MATLRLPAGTSLQLAEPLESIEFAEPKVVPASITVTLKPSADLELRDWMDAIFLPPTTCLSCGAKTNEHGVLPCGH